jgi:ribosome biogenesis GTPase
LIVLEKGGILIDNPGMREVGIADTNIGLELTFDIIAKLSLNCKFKNCTHNNEKGCSVLEAIENEEIDLESYNNFQKLQKEKAHYESSIAEKRKKDKEFGKMIKSIKKGRKRNKY